MNHRTDVDRLEPRRLLAAGPNDNQLALGAIADAADATLHTIYVDATGDLVHQTLAEGADENTGWSDKGVIDDSGRAQGGHLAIAIDNDGRPVVAYRRAGGDGELVALHMARATDNGWKDTRVERGGSAGLYPDVIVAPDGTAYAASFRKATGTAQTAVLRNNGTARTIDGQNDADTRWAGRNTALAMSADGKSMFAASPARIEPDGARLSAELVEYSLVLSLVSVNSLQNLGPNAKHIVSKIATSVSADKPEISVTSVGDQDAVSVVSNENEDATIIEVAVDKDDLDDLAAAGSETQLDSALVKLKSNATQQQIKLKLFTDDQPTGSDAKLKLAGKLKSKMILQERVANLKADNALTLKTFADVNQTKATLIDLSGSEKAALLKYAREQNVPQPEPKFGIADLTLEIDGDDVKLTWGDIVDSRGNRPPAEQVTVKVQAKPVDGTPPAIGEVEPVEEEEDDDGWRDVSGEITEERTATISGLEAGLWEFRLKPIGRDNAKVGGPQVFTDKGQIELDAVTDLTATIETIIEDTPFDPNNNPGGGIPQPTERSQVFVTWGDANDDELGYRVLRKSDSGGVEVLADLPPDSVDYLDESPTGSVDSDIYTVVPLADLDGDTPKPGKNSVSVAPTRSDANQ